MKTARQAIVDNIHLAILAGLMLEVKGKENPLSRILDTVATELFESAAWIARNSGMPKDDFDVLIEHTKECIAREFNAFVAEKEAKG